MAPRSSADARTTLAMAGALRTPVPAGISFAVPDVLAALAGDASGPGSLAGICRDLSLDFAFVQASAPDAEATAAAVAEEGAAVMWAVEGPLGPVLEARGWISGIAQAASYPEGMSSALDDRVLAAADEIERGLSAGASVIVLADDVASSAGPLVPPDFAFDEVFPRLARLVEIASAADVPCALHTDGDARVFLRAAKTAGFIALHGGGGLRWEAFARLHAAARTAGLAMIGGLPTVEIAESEASALRVGALAGELARAGGLLLADDGGLTTAEDAALYTTALREARTVASEGAPAR